MQGIRSLENKMDLIFYRIIDSVNIATVQKEMKNTGQLMIQTTQVAAISHRFQWRSTACFCTSLLLNCTNTTQYLYQKCEEYL